MLYHHQATGRLRIAKHPKDVDAEIALTRGSERDVATAHGPATIRPIWRIGLQRNHVDDLVCATSYRAANATLSDGQPFEAGRGHRHELAELTQ